MLQSRLDIVTTALARPDLLDLTYKSFLTGGIKNLPPFRIILNIDPLGGPHTEECISVAKKYCKSPLIRTPQTPNFMEAIKWSWSQVQSDYFIHLEDDWILNKPINFNEWFNQLHSTNNAIQSVLLMKKPWHHGYSFRPHLAKSSVCNLALSLPQSGNPEKKVGDATDAMGFVCLDFGNPYGITDTGRKWAKAHGLKKQDSENSWFLPRNSGIIQRLEYQLSLKIWWRRVNSMNHSL